MTPTSSRDPRPRAASPRSAAPVRLHFVHAALHLPRDLAVAEVPLHSAAQLRNVLGLREVHLEQEPRPRPEGQQIMPAPARATRAWPPTRTAWLPGKFRSAPASPPVEACRTPGRPRMPGGTSGSAGAGADRDRRRYRSPCHTHTGRRGSRPGSRRARVREPSATSITSARRRSLHCEASLVQFAERPVRYRIKQSRRDIRRRMGQGESGRRVGAVGTGGSGQVLLCPSPRSARERRCTRRRPHGAPAWAPALRPDSATPIGNRAPRRRPPPFPRPVRALPHIPTLSSRRICFSSVRMLVTCPTLVGTPQNKQVTRHVERARRDVALVGLQFHIVGTRQTLAQTARTPAR